MQLNGKIEGNISASMLFPMPVKRLTQNVRIAPLRIDRLKNKNLSI
jgi:hypothetical protein